MSDFIYDDQGKCIAWIISDDVFTGDNENRRKIATIDPRGNIFSLQGELVGRLQGAGLVRDQGGNTTPEAFTKLIGEKSGAA
jgi:hypothetical protein